MLIKQFLRFAIVGVIATFVHAGFVVILVEFFTVDPVVSSMPAYIAALFTAYLLNKTWSFQSRIAHINVFFPYTIVSTLGFGLNILIMYLLIDIFYIRYYIALTIVVVSIPVVTFFLHKHWTFNTTT